MTGQRPARRRIREPATTISDLLLAAVSAWFAASLLRSNAALQSGVWAAGFASAALGAVLGAVSHGLVEFVPSRVQRAAWLSTLFFAGTAGILFALAGTLAVQLDPNVVLAAGAIAAVTYLLAVLRAPAFRTTAVAYAISFAVLVVCAALLREEAPRASIWMVTAVALTAAGVVIQRAGISLHRHLNHNDIYHLFQIAAFVCLFQAARQLV